VLTPVARRGMPPRSVVVRVLGWFAMAGAIAVVVMCFYASLYRAQHLTVPIGWDTPRYLWRTALFRTLGFAHIEQGAPAFVKTDPSRPAFPVIAATMASLGHVSTFRIAAILPAVSAAAIALAAGAFVGAALRRPGWEIAVVALAVGTSAYLTRLLGPEAYQDNLLAAAVFMAAVVPMAFSLRDRAALVPAILLFGAGGLIHWAFFAFMFGVLGLAAVAYVPSSWRAWRRGEASLLDTPSARLGEIAAGGAAFGAVAILVVLATRPRAPHSVSLEFAKKLGEDIPKYHFSLALPVAAVGAGSLIAPAKDEAPAGRHRFALAFLLSWCVVSLAGFVAFKVFRVGVPAHRFLAFALAVPVLGGIGLTWIGRSLGRLARPVAAVVVLLALAASAYVSHREWFGTHSWVDPDKIEEAATAASYLDAAHISDGRPVVFIVLDRDASYVSLESHMIRAALPPRRIRQTLIYAGSPQGYLARRPTLGPHGRPTAVSQAYFRTVQPTYTRDPVVIMLYTFDIRYFNGWKAEHPSTLMGPGVALIRGPALSAAIPGAHAPIGQLSTAKIAVLALGMFGVLWIVGMGWTSALLGRWVGPREVVALAPAIGIAVVVVGGILIDRAGIRLSGASGAAAPFLLAALGGIVAWWLARHRSGLRTPSRAAGPDA
jgi:hypothetical protein